MADNISLKVVGHATTTNDETPCDNNDYETMTPTTSPDDDIYEPVSPRKTPEPAEDPEGYLIPYPDNELEVTPTSASASIRTGIPSLYEDLWAYSKQVNKRGSQNADNDESSDHNSDSIYDEVESMIPSGLPAGAKFIPVEEPPSAYDEVIINDGRYMIPSRQWDSDSDAFESDFDDDVEAPNYFGENLEGLYENLEHRKLASPCPRTMSFNMVPENDGSVKSRGGVLGACIPFTKNSKTSKESFEEEEAPLYVDPNSLGEKEPVMPPLSLNFSAEEAARYNIVKKIVANEATYKKNLNQLVQIEEELRDRKLAEEASLDVIFCSVQSILQSHEMFSMVLAARMNEWTVEGKLGDIICALFSKATTTMAYIDFVSNFLDAIDTFRAVCKNSAVFSQFVQIKIGAITPETTFHDLMLKPFERFPVFILLIQDLLEVTPVSHVDRVPLQLALTQLECLAELVNLRRKDSEMKTQLKYLDTQISQLNKPLSSSGRAFIRQDDMIHCLIDGVSVVGTKKLRLVLLSDMLLCLSPVGKKKRIMTGLLNTPKYKFKLKWSVPLSDVEFVEYGAGVSVAAGKYGTITTYSDQGKYRQATMEIQKHIEDLQHDLAVIGQIAGLASSLRGQHQLLDQQKVQRWYKSVQTTITEELKTVNMFWLELSLPTKSGHHNYVFNLSSPTVKEEWKADAMNAKLALESRNNPGWYLPEEDLVGGLSILRRNMPLLAEFFDLFIFNAKSRVEHTITYPVETATISTTKAARGLGYYVWISARGEMQGYVSVVRFDRDTYVPRFVESFNVCPGTVYSMAHIPSMNSRSDQSADKYHTKYGFPFPTVWLGSHSSKIYIYNAESEDRSRPLMELKLRDAPLAMRYASRKVYVGLANGTLAIFRSNTSDHWNLVQPAILPLGRFPVAVIADVKDKLWCSSGSQIYVVSKKGDRIQRIISVDPNMKSLVKHVVSCGVGVWVSVWKKAKIKLYHAETCEMIQEVNVVSPVMKMKNDVDSQVQYLPVEKISVTALLFIPGFLWVGTSVGLVLLYPLPKMQGVPRVIGRACVAFHAHCGPVRSLLAVPQGEFAKETVSDNMSSEGEDPSEINRKFCMLADSDESVESDEEFYFVDDNKNQSPKKKKPQANIAKPPRRFKAVMKGPEQVSLNSEITEIQSNGNPMAESSLSNPEEFGITKPDDFAKMMATFDGFNQDNSYENKEKDEHSVRAYRNKLFLATREGTEKKLEASEVLMLADNETSEKDALSGIGDNEVKSDTPGQSGKHTAESNDDGTTSLPSLTSSTNDSSDSLTEINQQTTAETTENEEHRIYVNISAAMSNEWANNSDVSKKSIKENDAQTPDESSFEQGKKGLTKSTQMSDDSNKKSQNNPTQTELQPNSLNETGNTKTPFEACKQLNSDNESISNPDFANSSTVSKSLERSQETYITVLPSVSDKLDGNESKISDDATIVEDLENDPDSRFSKTGKTRGKCLSYLVVSGGEGHVDLRLKVKSKQDIKKDSQSMFLIWRVNSNL